MNTLTIAILDAIVDGAYTAGTLLLGYMISAGQPVVPSKAAVLFACATGLVGALNQLRALKRQPPTP